MIDRHYFCNDGVRLPSANSHSGPWLRAAVAFSIFCGLVLLLNVHPVGDGDWFWYADALRHGKSLYGDLHMPMQPFFVLATEANQALLGTGWLAGKALAVVQLVAYSVGLSLLCRRLPLRDWQRAVVLLGAFFLTIVSSYARFDDFHITAHCTVVYSAWLLLRLRENDTPAAETRIAALLGLLSGVALATRLNDGGLLAVAVFACLLVYARHRRVLAVAIFSAVAALLLVLLIFATRSSLADWLHYTVVKAAGIKGGSAHVLLGPVLFPFKIARGLFTDYELILSVVWTAVFCAAVTVAWQAWQGKRSRRTATVAVAAVAALVTLVLIRRLAFGDKYILALADLFTLSAYLLVAFCLVHLVRLALNRRLGTWNGKEALLLLPASQIVSGAMTSGGAIDEALAPLACLLVLLPIVFPRMAERVWFRVAVVSVAGLFAGLTLNLKFFQPYAWHSYRNGPLFHNRTWYLHPLYGPMYLERPQLALMQGICGTIHPTTEPPQLLSMPWPYANYFCGIAPWRGYVQTWYDTSSRETIEALTRSLDTASPEWIVYQRSLFTLAANEKSFNHGARLPHRDLDDLVRQKLAAGAWSLPFQQTYDGSAWLVVHTRPALPGETNGPLQASPDH